MNLKPFDDACAAFEDYVKNLEQIAEAASQAMDYATAVEAIIQAAKMRGTVLNFQMTLAEAHASSTPTDLPKLNFNVS